MSLDATGRCTGKTKAGVISKGVEVEASLRVTRALSLDAGYTYSLLWVAGTAILVGIAAFWIGFSARQIATAQHTREAVEAGEL